MNIKHALIALAIFTLSCNKDNSITPVVEEVEKTIVNTRTVSKVDVGIKDKGLQNAKFSLLGYGYDAKEKTIYIINGLRNKVINMETVPAGRYNIIKANRAEGLVSEDLTKTEVLSLLNLSSTNPTNSSYLGYDFQKALPDNNISFARNIVIDRSFRLQGVGLKPENYNTDFNTAIATLTPEEIVKQFGTHLVSDFHQGFFYVLLKFVEKETETNHSITRHWQNLIFAAGADVSKIATTESGIDFGNYAGSYTIDNAQFVGFTDQNKQTPLYELLQNEDKKEALKSYIEAYLK